MQAVRALRRITPRLIASTPRTAKLAPSFVSPSCALGLRGISSTPLRREESKSPIANKEITATTVHVSGFHNSTTLDQLRETFQNFTGFRGFNEVNPGIRYHTFRLAHFDSIENTVAAFETLKKTKISPTRPLSATSHDPDALDGPSNKQTEFVRFGRPRKLSEPELFQIIDGTRDLVEVKKDGKDGIIAKYSSVEAAASVINTFEKSPVMVPGPRWKFRLFTPTKTAIV